MASYVDNPRLDVFNSSLVEGASYRGLYECPVVKVSHCKPEGAIPFGVGLRRRRYGQWVHFFGDATYSERIWRHPARYLPALKRFKGVITPDYECAADAPFAMRIWNAYRSRAVAYWLQSNGVRIVPSVSLGDEGMCEYAFEGLLPGGTVAVSVDESKDGASYLESSLERLARAIKPQAVIVHERISGRVELRAAEASHRF